MPTGTRPAVVSMFGVMSPVCLEDLGYTPVEFHATLLASTIYDDRVGRQTCRRVLTARDRRTEDQCSSPQFQTVADSHLRTTQLQDEFTRLDEFSEHRSTSLYPCDAHIFPFLL